MTFTEKHLASIAIALLLTAVIAVLFASKNTEPAHASAPSGLPSTIATTSVPAVTTTAALVFATSSCAARVITTTASPIMIGFSDVQGFVPTGVQGHLQAASTTVSYDSGLYGCGAVRIYSFVAQSITVSESR
jgi:hypothetical protein